MKMKIRKFTEEGHKKWVELYSEIFTSIDDKIVNRRSTTEGIKKGFNNDLKKRVKYLQNDESLSIELDKSRQLDFSKNYSNSYLLAKDINLALKDYQYSDINYDNKLWDWLSLMFFENVFNSEKMRGYHNYRYICDFGWQVSMRHLIRGPWWAFNRYGENSKIFTCTKTYQQNDALETFVKVNHMREMVTIPEVLMKLYYDYENERAIPGIFKVQKKVKPGSFTRFKDKISHFMKVMNLWEMSANDIINILPKEFDQYKN